MFLAFSNELGGFESGAVVALFGLVASVVSGVVGTLAVVAVALTWSVLARIGSLHTVRLTGREPERAVVSAPPADC